MPLGLAGFDWLEGLASWPATNLLPYLAYQVAAGTGRPSLQVRRTACLPLLFSCDPRFLFYWVRLGPSGATL
jgi:hypothetical protein